MCLRIQSVITHRPHNDVFPLTSCDFLGNLVGVNVVGVFLG